jgi:uncharacterized coiled-coil protein SlyX
MASFQVVVGALVLLFAIVVNAHDDEPDRPNYTEWKNTKEAEKNSAEAVAARNKKTAAVNKVISMLEDLRSQVLKEGEAEAKTYNTFSCWVKSTSADKQEAIAKGTDDKASLSATIESLASKRKELDEKIATLEGDISTAKKTMDSATAESNTALATYEKNEADLAGALAALKGAIKELKASKNPSLLQLQGISKTVSQAMIMADALGLDVSGLSMLQQEPPEVEMENYKFHSDGIIKTLEKLLGDFISEKTSVDADEVKRVQDYHVLMQEQTDIVAAKEKELTDTQKQKSEAQEEMAENSAALTTTSANLLDDQEYLKELFEISSSKAKTWDQRSRVRADELSALTTAIKIIQEQVAAKTSASTIRFSQSGVTIRLANAVATNENAMEAIEASAEEAEDGAPVGFLQKVQISRHEPEGNAIKGREAVADLLRSKGKQLQSKLLSSLALEVANQASEDVFAKVKVLIQELIERLLTESANEATHKGWCTKAIKDAEQKRGYAADEIADLNAQLGEAEAKFDKLKEQLTILEKEISDLNTSRAHAEKIRDEEKAENKATVDEAQEGLTAVQEAITILTRFYAEAAKGTVDMSLAQGPADDAPDAGFESGEAYKGLGGSEDGVVGMLQVIEGDFVRTIKETEKAEVQAEEDHLGYMTESGKSLAEKEESKKETSKYHDDTELAIQKDNESLTSQNTLLKQSIQELLELKPACIDTGMSYQDRVAHREEEIEALKKALCILNAYASYGPDGLADAC